MHEACFAFYDNVVASSFAEGTCLSISCDTGVYNARVDLIAFLIPETHVCEFAGDEVLYEDIRLHD